MTQIQKYQERLAKYFGSDQEFETMLHRMASVYKVPDADLNRPDVYGSIMQAVSYSLRLGAMPGIHVYMLPFNKRDGKQGDYYTSYQPMLSNRYYRETMADQAARNNWKIYIETEPMEPGEVRQYVTSNGLGGPYDEADRGYRARLWFSPDKEAAELFGRPYTPPWYYGFWRKNAEEKKQYENNKQAGTRWIPDNVPNGRDQNWVAEKRAIQTAILSKISPQPLPGWEGRSTQQRIAMLEDALTEIEPEEQSDIRSALPVMQDNSALWDEGDWEPIQDGTVASEEISDADKRVIIREETVNGWMDTPKPYVAALEWAMGNKLFDSDDDCKRKMQNVKGNRRPEQEAKAILSDFYDSVK